MGLEAATYLTDLVAANPVAGDPKSQGDDHLRLIKSALQATFPGLGGAFARVQAKGAGYTVVAADNSSIFRCSVALTLLLTAAATLGNKHTFAVYAEGGDVTIDGNAAETVNEVATVVVPKGSFAIVWCDGTEFIAAVLPRAKSGAGFLGAITGNTALTADDVDKVRRITATAVVTLPDTTTLVLGDSIKLKSLTTGDVTVARAGTDTIDGLTASYRLPAYETIELQYVAALTWVVVVAPRFYVGELKPVSFSTIPLGWVAADAAAISRATFAGYFAAVGTVYGVGDGSTTVNTPDSLGRTLVGAGAGSALTARTNGQEFGLETVSLTANQNGTHTHIQDPHSHTVNIAGGGISGVHINAGTVNDNALQAAALVSTVTATNQNSGLGSAHENMQPSFVATYMVKV